MVKHGSMAKVALAEVSECTLSDLSNGKIPWHPYGIWALSMEPVRRSNRSLRERQRRSARCGELVRGFRAGYRNFEEHPWLPWRPAKLSQAQR